MTQSQRNIPSKAALSPAGVRRLEQRYRRLKEAFLELGWIAHGSLMPQPPRAWRLTRKLKAKTVSLALSHEQALLYKKAITNQRKLEEILRAMRHLSDQVLQGSVPGVRKRHRQKRPKTRLS
jgi:hypothetical protein